MRTLLINDIRMPFSGFINYLLNSYEQEQISLDPSTLSKVQKSHNHLLNLIEKKIPLYGVTTGFGESCQRSLLAHQSEELQKNLINYLTCGTGEYLPEVVCRGTLLARLKSLSRGLSGVRPQLLERMQLFLNKNWIPAIPSEGSLGASGDLVPLASMAQCLQGTGLVYSLGKLTEVSQLLKQENIPSFQLKAKEGLALVNGTSVMTSATAVNIHHIQQLLNLHIIASTWTCLALGGRREAFGALVNQVASQHSGQTSVAASIATLLDKQGYQSSSLANISSIDGYLQQPVQDRYSLRCVPQILGPIVETLTLCKKWVEDELNTTSDNPLISDLGELANGGNFYGGYLAHSMDYLKICLVQMADMADRQLIQIMDENSSRGLPANLVNRAGLPEEEKHLHHGMKGLHQSVSALTSEIAALSLPNGIFSRSAESHNQDKVSLGMSAANQCRGMIEKSYSLVTMQLICLAQALDLKKISLKEDSLQDLYNTVRKQVDFINRDTPLQQSILNLKDILKKMPLRGDSFYENV